MTALDGTSEYDSVSRGDRGSGGARRDDDGDGREHVSKESE